MLDVENIYINPTLVKSKSECGGHAGCVQIAEFVAIITNTSWLLLPTLTEAYFINSSFCVARSFFNYFYVFSSFRLYAIYQLKYIILHITKFKYKYYTVP